MDRIETLRLKLTKIETEIEEARRRLPAHSIKPVFMAALFDLEDERDAIMAQLRQAGTGMNAPDDCSGPASAAEPSAGQSYPHLVKPQK